MTNQEIIEKIKKLLRMKRGGTSAEVETALNLAQELARKHGIDLANVDPNEESEQRRITHEDAVRSGRIQWESKYAMLIAQNFFNVTTVIRAVGWRQCVLTFIGTAWDVQIAIYVFRFLVGHFRREWNSRRGRCRNRQAFMYGMFIGLSTKLSEKRPMVNTDGLALIVHDKARRDRYMQTTFGETKQTSTKPDGDAAEAKYRGWLAGRETEIREGVGTNEKNQLLLS
jgi:hypothetical protein